MRIFYSYVLLCLHSLLFINRSLSSSVSSCNDPISCALSDVSIEINNLNISISNSTDFVINTLLCTNITVLSIPSTYLPPTSLNLGIQDAFVSCFGKYTYEQVSGQVKVLLNKLSLDLEVDLVPKNLTSVNYPWAFVVPQCFGSLVATVDLIGTGRSAPVVKKLENIIASALETTIPNITCTKLSTTLQVNATNTLETKIDPLLLLITSQPTSIQIPPYDSSYINWHQILTLIDTVFSVIKASDPSVADKFQRPLINMLINKITDNTGAFTLPVNKVLNLGGGGNITINSIIISGLNTFEDAALLSPSPLSNVAIRSRIGLGTLDLLINATVSLPPTPNYVYTEWILIEGKLVNTSLVLDTVIPVTKSSLNELYVNQLTQPGCWIDTITVASLALETTVDTLAISQVRGSAVQLDKDAIALVDNILELVIDGYGPLLTEVINSIVGIKLQPVVNEKLQALVSELSCTHVCPSNSDYVVWADNTLVKALGHILNDVIGPVGLNTILRLITRGTGSLILNTDHAIVTLGGLASFNTLSVLQPSANSPYDLTSMIGLGNCNSQLCTPVSLTLNIVGGLNNISLPFTLPPSITSKLSGSGTEIFIALSNLNIQLETMIELSQGLLCDLRVGQLGTRGCLLSTAQMIALKSLNLQVTAAQTSIHGQPPHDSTALVQKVLSSLNSPSTLESINSKLIDIPVNSNRTCEGLSALPHPTKAPVKTTHNISASDFGSVPSSSTDSAYSYWEVPVVILCVLSAVMLLGFCCYREYKVYATPLRNSDSKAENDFADTSNSSNSICGWIYNMKWGESIIGSNKISFLTKAFVIVSLGVCFGLFILCLLDKDILTIKTSLTTQNKNTEITIYDVALPDIINDLWDSGSYLASFLGGFGYVWCYPVIVIAFLCFVLPPDVLPVSHRRNWLSFACLAAKANNVNWFFSVYFDPLFYFNVQPAPTLDVLTYWVIERGFTIYACVFFYFLVLLQIMRGCDRVVTAEVPIVPPTDAIVATKATELECMKDHVFTVSADLVPSKYLPDDKGIAANDNQVLSIRFTALTKTIVLILIFASFIFLLCSSILETMTYKILGLLSLLITEDPTSQFSLISIAQYFPQTTGDSSNSAGLFVTALFILYSVVIPLMSVIGIAALWLIPMKSSFQRNLYIFTEACFAFSQFDVAVLTLIVNTQTDSFAAFLALVIGNYCDGINVILAEYLDTALDGNDQCFTISTHLSKNSWTIFVALVCYLSLVLLALICFGIACEERHVLTSTSAETQNQVQPVSSMKASTKAKLNSKDLNEPLLIRNNDELILNSESYPPTQTLSTWRKVKSTFLGSCLILSIVEISESSSKVVRHSMDGREIDPTFN